MGLLPFPGRCAASARSRASSTRYGDALQIRGPCFQKKRMGPGSAKQRYALHRARDTGLAEGAEAIAEQIEPTWRADFGFASR